MTKQAKYSQMGSYPCGLRNHLMDMLIGKQNGARVRKCKGNLNRFPKIWIPEDYSASIMKASQNTKGNP